MTKCIALLVYLGITSGCSLDNFARKGAEYNDKAVTAAKFTLCWGASIGSIRREFGDDPEVWKLLCAQADDLEITE